MRARALWQKQESHDEKRGQQLWYMFKNMVVLDEQMRQQQDIDYHQLLQRVRNGTITQADVDLLIPGLCLNYRQNQDLVRKALAPYGGTSFVTPSTGCKLKDLRDQDVRKLSSFQHATRDGGRPKDGVI